MVLKAELHCHAEGSVSPALARDMATRRGADIGDLITEDGSSYRWTDFTEFLAAYDRVAALFRTEADYSELSYGYFTDIAADGAIYGEMFVSPSHAGRIGLGYASYIAGLADGIIRAQVETGIVGRIVPVAERHYGPEQALDDARRVAAMPHPLVTGFGMAGDERMCRPAEFAPAFAVAADAGLGLTVHAGEVCGCESVRAAIDALPVTRIGHGVRAIDDLDLVRRLAGEGTVLEVCPGSNVALGLYPDRRRHPLDALRQAGVAVTISSDDPPFFRTSLAEEYRRTGTELGYGNGTLATLTRTALDAAFVDETTRAQLIQRLEGAAETANDL